MSSFEPFFLDVPSIGGAGVQGKTLFIGDLSYFCAEQDLHSLLAPFGAISEVRIRRGVTGESLMHGFVQMESSEAAKKIIETLDGFEFMGRNMRIQLSEDGLKSGLTKESLVQVHVSFITKQDRMLVTEKVLREIFSAHGTVADVTIKKHTLGQQHQSGYGFVYYYEHPAANRAMMGLKGATVREITFDCSISYKVDGPQPGRGIPKGASMDRRGQQQKAPRQSPPPILTHQGIPQQGLYGNTATAYHRSNVDQGLYSPQMGTPYGGSSPSNFSNSSFGMQQSVYSNSGSNYYYRNVGPPPLPQGRAVDTLALHRAQQLAAAYQRARLLPDTYLMQNDQHLLRSNSWSTNLRGDNFPSSLSFDANTSHNINNYGNGGGLNIDDLQRRFDHGLSLEQRPAPLNMNHNNMAVGANNFGSQQMYSNPSPGGAYHRPSPQPSPGRLEGFPTNSSPPMVQHKTPYFPNPSGGNDFDNQYAGITNFLDRGTGPSRFELNYSQGSLLNQAPVRDNVGSDNNDNIVNVNGQSQIGSSLNEAPTAGAVEMIAPPPGLGSAVFGSLEAPNSESSAQHFTDDNLQYSQDEHHENLKQA